MDLGSPFPHHRKQSRQSSPHILTGSPLDLFVVFCPGFDCLWGLRTSFSDLLGSFPLLVYFILSFELGLEPA